MKYNVNREELIIGKLFKGYFTKFNLLRENLIDLNIYFESERF